MPVSLPIVVQIVVGFVARHDDRPEIGHFFRGDVHGIERGGREGVEDRTMGVNLNDIGTFYNIPQSKPPGRVCPGAKRVTGNMHQGTFKHAPVIAFEFADNLSGPGDVL